MPQAQFISDRPVALSVAGSDCSAGAGLQADLKTFTAFGVYGLTALTCAVSEVPGEVERIEAMPPDFLSSQVELLCRHFPVQALKTGMLYSTGHVMALVQSLERAGFSGALVVDPVMVASSGDSLIREDAVRAYRDLLFPRASVLTPNLDEAGVLLGRALTASQDLEPAARELCARYGVAVLVKGGHLEGAEAIDFLCEDGTSCETFCAPRVEGVKTHGTGCTYSAAIAAGLAHGRSLHQSVADAKAFVTKAISRALEWGSPPAPIHALNHRLE